MLKIRTSKSGPTNASKKKAAGGHFAIVASSYNAKYVDSMLKAAQSTLRAAGAAEIEVVRVPGAFEIPVVASALARRVLPRVSAVICLGVILRGATTHAQHIGESVTQALVSIQVHSLIPVIHEVLLLENEDQAKTRCLDPKYNRGFEAAEAAIHMAALMRTIQN